MPQHLGAFKGRISIAAFKGSGKGLVAGFRDLDSAFLSDTSGKLRLPPALLTQLGSGPDWLAIFLDDQGYRLVYQQRIAASAEVRTLRKKQHLFKQRLQIHEEIRRFFLDNDFLECDTPVAVPCPGMEPYLDSFCLGKNYLRTSPELHMKRLLAAGFDRIFQMGPCFRAGDVGRYHREEFLLLEWYRAFADLQDLIEDLSQLLGRLAVYAIEPDYFAKPLRVVSCHQLFREHLGLELTLEKAPLEHCLRKKGISFTVEDDWDTLFFLLFLNYIEPHLGQLQPEVVTNYPASQAALAKIAPEPEGGLPVCYRFELYLKGLEVANAFYELTDERLQRQRFQVNCQQRATLGKVVYELDEDFLAALASGLPPSAGIALGLDRLVISLLNQNSLDELLPF